MSLAFSLAWQLIPWNQAFCIWWDSRAMLWMWKSLLLDRAAAALINSWLSRTFSTWINCAVYPHNVCAVCRHPSQHFAATLCFCWQQLKTCISYCMSQRARSDLFWYLFPFSIAPSCLVVVVYLRIYTLKQILNLPTFVNHWLIVIFCIYFLLVLQQAVLFQRSWLDFWKSQWILTTISWQFWN